MAQTWLELAMDARRAAKKLARDSHVRSAVSRAYYAVYSKVTHELVSGGVTMPPHRHGPSHHRLRQIIEKGPSRIRLSKRVALSRMVSRLYVLRLDADYKPVSLIDDREAREAVAMMDTIFDAF